MITGADLSSWHSSAKAMKTSRNVKQVLQIAKPIQIKLREWRRDLPESLHMESTKARKKSSTGSLHLAYYAAEVILHKAIIFSLSSASCDPSIIDVCRGAARERAISSIEFVRSLKPEQIQSFWHFRMYQLQIFYLPLLPLFPIISTMTIYL